MIAEVDAVEAAVLPVVETPLKNPAPELGRAFELNRLPDIAGAAVGANDTVDLLLPKESDEDDAMLLPVWINQLVHESLDRIAEN